MDPIQDAVLASLITSDLSLQADLCIKVLFAVDKNQPLI